MPPTKVSRLLCPLLRFEQPLALIGLWWVSTLLLHWGMAALSGLHYYFLVQLFPARDYRRYGRWAVVLVEPNTLSIYYAEELARKHLDLLLIGVEDDREALDQFAEDMNTKYGVTVEVLCYNPTEEDPFDEVKERVKSLDSIAVMVNQLPARPEIGPHATLPDCDESNIIRALLLTTDLSKLVLRRMAAQQTGFVVIISDPSAEYPHAYLAAHSAACAYLDYFSRSLNWEVSCAGVRVQSLTPYPVPIPGPEICTWCSIPPQVIARHAVNGIGKARSSGYWVFGLRGFLSACVPRCIRTYWRYLRNRPRCCSLMALEN